MHAGSNDHAAPMSRTACPTQATALDWDHLVPLLSGQVQVPGYHVEIEARNVTPDVVAEPGLDGGETSFSRYVQARAAGDDQLVALPAFVMRGFRHRCVLVRAPSTLRSFEQLAGARIGLTGWPDSGNTWTRASCGAGGLVSRRLHRRLPADPPRAVLGGMHPRRQHCPSFVS